MAIRIGFDASKSTWTRNGFLRRFCQFKRSVFLIPAAFPPVVPGGPHSDPVSALLKRLPFPGMRGLPAGRLVPCRLVHDVILSSLYFSRAMDGNGAPGVSLWKCLALLRGDCLPIAFSTVC